MKAIQITILLILFIGVAFAENTWNCSTDSSCTQNIDNDLWSCSFYNCSEKPTEIINMTVYNFTNSTQTINFTCNESAIADNISNSMICLLGNLSDQINSSYNYSEQYAEMKASWQSCSDAYQQLLNESENGKKVSQEECERNLSFLRSNISISGDIIADKENEKMSFALGGIIAGMFIIWFFKIRKPEASNTGIASMINPEQSYSNKAIENNIQKEKSRQQELEELKDEILKSFKGHPLNKGGK